MLAEIVWDADMIRELLKFSIPLAVIIGALYVKLAKTRSEHDLKRSMVERGMSVEEIERVLAARPARKAVQ